MLQISPLAAKSYAKVRADLEWVRYAADERWVVHDPIDNRFFYLNQLEQYAISLLNGNQSTSELVDQLLKQFPSEPITPQWVDSLIAKFTAAGLVWHSCSAGVDCATKKKQANTSFLLRLIGNLAGFKVNVFDPTFLVGCLSPIAYLLFSPLTMITVGASAVACVLACVFEWLGPSNYGDRSIDIFQPSQFWIVFFLWIFIKAVHELGHLLACIRWGVHCREVGVLMLFFAPCPYCDTTEAWRLSSRWQRAMIAAGGIYMEIILSCISAVLWLNAENPLEKSIFAWVMILCSVGTIAINGNPFLKYDGYYILSDIWGVPNLSQHSQRALWQCFVWALGGNEPAYKTFPKNIWLLATYGFVSGIYRFALLLTINWVLWQFFEPLGLGVLAIIIAASTISGVCLMVNRFVISLVSEFFRPNPIRFTRFLCLMAAMVSVCLFVLLVPVETFVRARGFLELANREPVYVMQDAHIDFLARGAVELKSDTSIVSMTSVEKLREQKFLESDLVQAKRKYELLSNLKSTDASGAYEMPALAEHVRELESRNEIIKQELEKTSVRARESASFYPAAPRSPEWLTDCHWESESSLSHSLSSGAWLPQGTLLGWLSLRDEFHVVSIVTESDMKSLRLNMVAEFMCDSDSNHVFHGEVMEIANEPIDSLPSELLGDTSIVVSRDSRGKIITDTPHYLVTIRISGELPHFFPGALVSVRFRVESSTLIDRVWRYLRQTYRLAPRYLESTL